MDAKTEPKKWGFYLPSGWTEDIMSQLSEIDIWKKIDNLGGALFYANHDAGRPWATNYTDEEMLNAQYLLQYLVYYTRNFGVEFGYVPDEEHTVENSASYRAWYKFWKDYFDAMSDEEYNAFVDAKFSGQDISMYMPKNNWKDEYQASLKQ